MKSITLKIGTGLFLLYATGWLWLPYRVTVVLYTFDLGMIERTLANESASEYASSKCLGDSTVSAGKSYDRCWDSAKAEYLAKKK